MKKRSLATICGTSIICLFTAPSLFAEEADTLDDIVVTADRKARTVDETLAPVTIITRQDIEKYQASDVADVLRRVPGVNIMNQGGAGQLTSVFLRGTNSNHTLVLIDGIKVGSTTLGATAFEHLPLDQVERIEVVRGARSSLYGSEAIGGVIQIFTRKGNDKFTPSLQLEAGSHNYKKLSASVGNGNENNWFNISASTQKTDGFDVYTQAEPDDDSYKRNSASFNAGHRFNNGIEVTYSGMRAEGDYEYDDPFAFYVAPSGKSTQHTSSLNVKAPVSDKWKINVQAGQARDKLEGFDNGSSQFLIDTRRNTVSVQNEISLAEQHDLTVGADYLDDKIADASYARNQRDNLGTFIQYRTNMGNNTIELTARHDDNEQFGSHNTGGVTLAHEMENGLHLTASHGTAFKNPTMGDLYSPWGANPDLRPEHARNTEIGVRGQLANGKWSVNLYKTSIDDIIVADTFWIPQNLEKAKITGLELTTQQRIADLDVNANLTVQKPENAGTTNNGNLLQRRAENTLNIDVDRDFGRTKVGASLHAESKRYDDAANLNKLPGYATVDLRTSYALNEDWTLGGKIGNVFDKEYETAQYYQQDGRNVLVDLRYAPK